MTSLNHLLLLKQTFFSLPWLVATFILLRSLEPIPTHGILFWMSILLGFFSARWLGMSLNRLIDFEIDRKNPRTALRPLQTGEINPFAVRCLVVGSFFFYFVSALYIGWFTLFLSLPPLFLILTYSYTKRWTPFCHFWMGGIYFFIPPLVSVACWGKVFPVTWLLGGAFGCLVAGADILYAFQDREIDRKEGLYSFPASFGIEISIWVVRGLAFFVGILLSLTCFLSFFPFSFLLAPLFFLTIWIKLLFSPNIRDGKVADRVFSLALFIGGVSILLGALISS